MPAKHTRIQAALLFSSQYPFTARVPETMAAALYERQG